MTVKKKEKKTLLFHVKLKEKKRGSEMKHLETVRMLFAKSGNS